MLCRSRLRARCAPPTPGWGGLKFSGNLPDFSYANPVLACLNFDPLATGISLVTPPGGARRPPGPPGPARCARQQISQVGNNKKLLLLDRWERDLGHLLRKHWKSALNEGQVSGVFCYLLPESNFFKLL